MEIGKFIFVMYLQDRNFFQKIALLFGKDVIVSRWLKQHGNKPLHEIAAEMSSDEIDEAIDFLKKMLFVFIKEYYVLGRQNILMPELKKFWQCLMNTIVVRINEKSISLLGKWDAFFV